MIQCHNKTRWRWHSIRVVHSGVGALKPRSSHSLILIKNDLFGHFAPTILESSKILRSRKIINIFHWFSILPRAESETEHFSWIYGSSNSDSSEHEDYCERCLPVGSWKREICVIMLFIPFFVLVVVLALPCMSNYRKIYASSDRLICSLSNDFLHFSVLLLSLPWFMPPQWRGEWEISGGRWKFFTATSKASTMRGFFDWHVYTARNECRQQIAC